MPRGGSRPKSRAPLEKPPCRRSSQRFRFFSPPISSGETSATIGSKQPIVPRRLRLASTIRGSSEPSRTLRSWIAPETTRAASSLVSPCNVCTNNSSSRFVSFDSIFCRLRRWAS